MGHICEAITIESVLIYSLSIFPQFRHNVYYRKGYYYLNNNKYISQLMWVEIKRFVKQLLGCFN